jgi:hypothetical protein
VQAAPIDDDGVGRLNGGRRLQRLDSLLLFFDVLQH